jgi:hypothetical protein
MKVEEFIKYIEQREGKKIEELCKGLEDHTIIWINPGITHKYQLLLWDTDFQEITIREVNVIMKGHPKIKWVQHWFSNNATTSISSSSK